MSTELAKIVRPHERTLAIRVAGLVPQIGWTTAGTVNLVLLVASIGSGAWSADNFSLTQGLLFHSWMGSLLAMCGYGIFAQVPVLLSEGLSFHKGIAAREERAVHRKTLRATHGRVRARDGVSRYTVQASAQVGEGVTVALVEHAPKKHRLRWTWSHQPVESRVFTTDEVQQAQEFRLTLQEDGDQRTQQQLQARQAAIEETTEELREMEIAVRVLNS